MKIKLREIRKKMGMTQAQLSTASGVNRISIARYETGATSPALCTAQKLAAALGVTVDELIGKGDGS